MPSEPGWRVTEDWLTAVDAVVGALRSTGSVDDLSSLMGSIAREFDCRYYALIHHDDLRSGRRGCVDVKHYPSAIEDRLFGQCRYRRDPIIRGCIFADGVFLWSDLHRIMHVDRHDRAAFAFGATEGLNEGITVPYHRHGECMGSCTFAGMKRPETAERYLGPAHMIGVFAFRAAMRLLNPTEILPMPLPRLKPRPRDCVVLAGRGLSNKEIARALALTPRTVDGYLTEARRLFGAHDRTELVVSAVLAGEVCVHELKARQAG